jgi:hypothetical protein
MSKMSTRLVNDELVVIVHGKEGPEEDEWQEYMDVILEHVQKKGTLPPVLVYSAGGGPEPSQRKRAVAITEGLKSRVALITQRPFPRSVAAVASFFGITIRPFSTIRHFEAVVEYLGLAEKTKTEAERELTRMAQQLGVALE